MPITWLVVLAFLTMQLGTLQMYGAVIGDSKREMILRMQSHAKRHDDTIKTRAHI